MQWRPGNQTDRRALVGPETKLGIDLAIVREVAQRARDEYRVDRRAD